MQKDCLAIVVGKRHELSDQTIDLAQHYGLKFCAYTIGSAGPTGSKDSRLVSSGSGRMVVDNFAWNGQKLDEDRIGSIFFVGEPEHLSGLFFQSFLEFLADLTGLGSRGLRRLNRRLGDKLFWDFYDRQQFLGRGPLHYLSALQAFLRSKGVIPKLASEIFEDLTLPPVGSTSVTIPVNINQQLEKVTKDYKVRTLKQIWRFAARPVQAAVYSFSVVSSRRITIWKFLAIEGMRGTDALLRSLPSYDTNQPAHQELRVLIKLPHPLLHPSMAPPVIGPATIRECARAGVRGIIFCAEATIVVNRDLTVELANENGMFIYGVSFNQLREYWAPLDFDSWLIRDPRVVLDSEAVSSVNQP